MWEAWVQSLGQEDPLEEGVATHSSILAWRIPWTEEPGRVSKSWVQLKCLNTHAHTHQSKNQAPSLLAHSPCLTRMGTLILEFRAFTVHDPDLQQLHVRKPPDHTHLFSLGSPRKLSPSCCPSFLWPLAPHPPPAAALPTLQSPFLTPAVGFLSSTARFLLTPHSIENSK